MDICGDLGRLVAEQSALLRQFAEAVAECRKAMREQWALVGELNVRAMRQSFMVAAMWKKMRRDLREAVLSIHRDILERLGVSVEKVERVKVVDSAGVLKKGLEFEIDVVHAGGDIYLLEARHVADIEDLQWFVLKCEVAEANWGRRAKRRIFVAVNIERAAVEKAEALGVDVVYGAVLD